MTRHRLPGLPGRGALMAEFGSSHGRFAVFVLHLALGQGTRLRQMRSPAGGRAGKSITFW